MSRGTRSGGGTKAAVGGGTRTGVPADPGENTSCCLADGRVGVIIVYLDTILQVVLGLEVVRRLQWVEAQGLVFSRAHSVSFFVINVYAEVGVLNECAERSLIIGVSFIG